MHWWSHWILRITLKEAVLILFLQMEQRQNVFSKFKVSTIRNPGAETQSEAQAGALVSAPCCLSKPCFWVRTAGLGELVHSFIHALTHSFIHLPNKSVVRVYHADSTAEGTGCKELWQCLPPRNHGLEWVSTSAVVDEVDYRVCKLMGVGCLCMWVELLAKKYLRQSSVYWIWCFHKVRSMVVSEKDYLTYRFWEPGSSRHCPGHVHILWALPIPCITADIRSPVNPSQEGCSTWVLTGGRKSQEINSSLPVTACISFLLLL